MKITDKRSQFQNNEEVDKKPTEDMSLISKIISGIVKWSAILFFGGILLSSVGTFIYAIIVFVYDAILLVPYIGVWAAVVELAWQIAVLSGLVIFTLIMIMLKHGIPRCCRIRNGKNKKQRK